MEIGQDNRAYLELSQSRIGGSVTLLSYNLTWSNSEHRPGQVDRSNGMSRSGRLEHVARWKAVARVIDTDKDASLEALRHGIIRYLA